MHTPFFTDPHQAPTLTTILQAVGPAAPLWTELFDRIHAAHPDLDEAWRYYVDGKSWLLKVTRRSKTVCWVAVEHGAFRVAFYFPERLAGALLAGDLSDPLKAAIRSGQPIGKLRGVSVTFGAASGVADVLALISLKKALK